jgi:hypothetical protein
MGATLGSLMSREAHRLRAFENRLLVGVFGLIRVGVVGGSRKLYNKSNLYSSPSIIRMNKSMKLRWEEQVTCMGRRGMQKRYSWERQKEIDHSDMWEDNIPMDLMYCNVEYRILD